MFESTGIDKALQLAAQGCTKLEYTAKPTLKDKKDAQEYFKRAAEILKSVVGLESEGVYETGPKPDPEPEVPLPGVPLNFDGPEPEAFDDPLEAFGGLTPEQQVDWFDTKLSRLVERIGSPVDITPWVDAFNANRPDAFLRLLIAEAKEGASIDIPTDEERAAYLLGLKPTEPEQAPTDENFSSLLDRLESEGLEQGELALKDWKASEKAWKKAWKSDPEDTFRRLRFAIYDRTSISWAIPTDEEMTPAEEPEFRDPLAEEGGEA